MKQYGWFAQWQECLNGKVNDAESCFMVAIFDFFNACWIHPICVHCVMPSVLICSVCRGDFFLCCICIQHQIEQIFPTHKIRIPQSLKSQTKPIQFPARTLTACCCRCCCCCCCRRQISTKWKDLQETRLVTSRDIDRMRLRRQLTPI